MVLVFLALGAGVARADVTFTDNARMEFDIDEDGNPNDEGGLEELDLGWERFWRAPEGQRIFTFLDMVDVEVVVDVLPADQVGSGDSAGRVYGTAKIEERNEAGIPTRIRIKIRNERIHGIDNLADTIWHEFRHAEIWIQGDDHEHDELDDDESDLNEKFRADVQSVVASSTTLGTPETPHYDRITDRATGRALKSAAYIFGDILDDIRDSISFNQPTYSAEFIDLESYGAGKYGYADGDVTITFNESIVECGDRTEDYVVACAADGVQEMPAGEVGVFHMDLAGDVPLGGLDHSLIYSLVLDSDADSANDWVFNPPFDWDFFQGADRWYQLFYDHRDDSWHLTVTQLTATGQIPGSTEPSTVRAVVEDDTVTFFVSMSEFSSAAPTYRLTAFGHDGNFSESDRGGDVSGSNPTEPLTPIPPEVFEAAPQE